MFTIGFTTSGNQESKTEKAVPAPREEYTAPRKSVVQVAFANCGKTFAYYNDRFDLHVGDLVYVEGKFAGLHGRVTSVNYTFKIKISDYKRVIAGLNTEVHGRFFAAGGHFFTFEKNALPAKQAAAWFLPPSNAEEEFLVGSDGASFPLDDLKKMGISPTVAERGHEYYMQNKVAYLSLDGEKGYAIVEGSENYEVEFTYRSGEISDLVCSCYCSFTCKHEFAVMLQLKELLARIEEQQLDEYQGSGCFTAVSKNTFFSVVLGNLQEGCIAL